MHNYNTRLMLPGRARRKRFFSISAGRERTRPVRVLDDSQTAAAAAPCDKRTINHHETAGMCRTRADRNRGPVASSTRVRGRHSTSWRDDGEHEDDDGR